MSPQRRTADVTSICASRDALLQHGPILRDFPSERLVRALAFAARRLDRAEDELGKGLRAELRESTGLSPAMIEWGLTTTLRSVDPLVLEGLRDELLPKPSVRSVTARSCAVILAGNVFSASVRALFVPLLAGVPVIAKASSRDDVLPRYLKRALDLEDPGVGSGLEIVTFAHDEQGAKDTLAALIEHAEVISVYGSDETVRELSQMQPLGARFLPHGHGISAVYVSAESLSTPARALDAARHVALDVAAYDQRGCLSPHFVFVEHGAVEPQAFAKLLSEEALSLFDELLPRGQLELHEESACMQWRAVAAVQGELYAGKSHAVGYAGEAPARPSPGFRHVSVHACASPEALAEQLSPFARHLKCVGVSGSRSVRARIAAQLERRFAPELCRAGEMQTPPFDAPTEGHPPLHGYVRQLHIR